MIGSFLTTWTHYHRCEGNRVTVQRSIPAFSRLIEANCVFRRQECQPLSNAPALMRWSGWWVMTDHWSTDDNVLVIYNHDESMIRSKTLFKATYALGRMECTYQISLSRPNALFRSDEMVILVMMGCTQTAYVGSLVTMLVLHASRAAWRCLVLSPNPCFIFNLI